jgi:RNA polymerase sigma-70 factor (ECF subfamily)
MLQDSKNNNFSYKDEELILQFQQGNENAFVELVDRYKNKLINFTFNYLGDRDLAEDIVQETMLKLYEKRHYYKPIAKFSTWIYTIARNQANTELRKRKRRKISFLSQMTKNGKDFDLDSKAPDLIDEFHNTYLAQRINKAIQLLPEHFREVIVLRDIQGLSYEDIGSVMDAPLGTIKSRINRARIQLQAELHDLKKYRSKISK